MTGSDCRVVAPMVGRLRSTTTFLGTGGTVKLSLILGKRNGCLLIVKLTLGSLNRSARFGSLIAGPVVVVVVVDVDEPEPVLVVVVLPEPPVGSKQTSGTTCFSTFLHCQNSIY